jgi:hypothetical protein
MVDLVEYSYLKVIAIALLVVIVVTVVCMHIKLVIVAH